MQLNPTLEYALNAYCFLLPMNGTLATEDWAQLIEKHFDQSCGRHLEVVAAIRTCPIGSTISRNFGGGRVVLTMPSSVDN